MFAVHGDADELVPLAANSAALAARYRELGAGVADPERGLRFLFA